MIHDTWRRMTAEDRLKLTHFVVEASTFEQFSLWQRYHEKHAWEQANGYLVTVGHVNKLPVCISIMWDIIDGHYIAFYDPTSRMVDHKMIDDWLDWNFKGTWDHGRKAQCNADNFHLCIASIKESK